MPNDVLAQSDTLLDGDLVRLDPCLIDVKTGFNPRQYFDPKAQEDLDYSVAKQGVIQPIVIRKQSDIPGYYWVIAGERRLRAAKNTQQQTIPCLYRDVDERQALAIAITENNERDNLSPAEEAQEGQRMLSACDGDRDETLRILGWSRDKFEARQLLLHADQTVLDAIARREIKLGIAELLSCLPRELQAEYLPKIIEKRYTVAEVRQRIDQIAQKLDTAVFKTDECLHCPHNSDTQAQASLFSDVTAGQCTGRRCYAEKSKAALETVRDELLEQYNCVYLDVEKPDSEWVFLLKDGRSGVGEEQYNTCHNCAHFGALLLSEPGRVGEIERNICFDLSCNGKKVALWMQKTEGSATSDIKTTNSSVSSTSKNTKPKKKISTTNETPKRVRALAHQFLMEQASEVAKRDPATVRALSLYCLLLNTQQLSLISKGYISRADAYNILHEISDSELDKLEAKAIEQMLSYKGHENSPEHINTAIQIIATTEQNLTGIFKLDRRFLEAHTKSGINALMNEATNPEGITFDKWYDNNENNKSMKKLLSNKVGDLVDTILKTEFDFSQWVPSCILQEVSKIKKSK